MAKGYTFDIYKDKAGEFRFRFRAPNGEKMFASEGYASKSSAMSTIKSVIKNVGKAAIEDNTKAAPKAAKKSKTKK